MLCSPAALAQTRPTERCDRAPGLEKVLAQWHAELVRIHGEKFLQPVTADIETDCFQRRVLFPRWWKALDGTTKQKAMVQPNTQSVADCRRLVGTLEQWRGVLDNPQLSAPAAVKCGAPPRGGGSAPSDAPARPAYPPGRIP